MRKPRSPKRGFFVFPIFKAYRNLYMRHRLQKCSLSELDDLVRISKKTFADAFEKDNDSNDFKAYIDFAFDKEKILSELNDSNTSFYFAYRDEFLAGYFKLNRSDAQTDLKLKESIELERIYVLEQFQGMKMGQWMLTRAIILAKKEQKQFIWLGVWEENSRAVQFYEKYGFVKFGKHPYYIGADKQMDWLMRHDLINLNTK